MSDVFTQVWDTLRSDAIVAEKWVVTEVTGLEAQLASAIALPFWRAVEPQIMADLEAALKALLEEAGTLAVTYLTGGTVTMAEITTGLLQKAEAIGVTSLSTLEPYALQAWIGLKALAAKAEADVQSVLDPGASASAASPSPPSP